jgi:hypothetical protein
MKNSFFGYYSPSGEQYARLWKDGLIVLDTNVLLSLYRVPATARDEILTVLELLKERLWIPHQVALEFQRRRITVISGERKSTENALTSATDLVTQLKQKVDALQIDKHGLGIVAKPLIEDLEHANSKLIEAIRAVQQSQLDIAASDPIRERLDRIFCGRVGVGPTTQEELDALTQGGDDRFRDKIPPGFEDIGKDKNPNEATFIHDHLKYQRKFGDLILWRQLIKHVKQNETRTVLLVTEDQKKDWWWQEQGKTIGAHPELVREICRESSVELFWMYSSVQFMEHATKYTTAKVSDESVAELEQVSHSAPSPILSWSNYQKAIPTPEDILSRGGFPPFHDRIDDSRAQEAVASWLLQSHDDVHVNIRGFPDLLVTQGDELHGYEVKFLRNFNPMFVPPTVVNAARHGLSQMKEGRLSRFTLVIAISEDDCFEMFDHEKNDEMCRRFSRLLVRYPISEIIIGGILEESFEPLAHLGGG